MSVPHEIAAQEDDGYPDATQDDALRLGQGGRATDCFVLMNRSLSGHQGEYPHATLLSGRAFALYAHRFAPELHARIAP